MKDLDTEYKEFKERISETLNQKIQDACLERLESVKDESNEAD